MKVIVLGASAGGGFPQWNCACANCKGLREGTIRARPRTQSSIALSANGSDWLLINASPDILTQIRSIPALQPRRAPRDSPIRGVLLVDSQIDHTTGLLMLREGAPLEVYCTPQVHQDLSSGNPILNVLGSYCGIHWHPIPVVAESSFEAAGIEGLRLRAIAVRSKAPPYSPHRNAPCRGDNVALVIEDGTNGRRLLYAPGLEAIDADLAAALARADCLLVDGTFWTDDEMIAANVGHKHARDMGHRALSGTDGMLAVLTELPAARKILIHINNTNPILNEDSAERGEVERRGIEVAYDGMEIEL